LWQLMITGGRAWPGNAVYQPAGDFNEEEKTERESNDLRKDIVRKRR
jgi:hypothetical protein